MILHPIALLHKAAAVLMATFKPLGIWGLGALAFIDSGLFPLPTTMDGVVIGYVAANHSKFFLYCLMAAFASAIGSLIPYYVGRAGGELFLLKRINRERYEALRDRFENQEFVAIMFPAMMPPPTPIKLFEFAAGVFEMRPLLFATAIFTGKLIQFFVCAIITVYYGPQIAETWRHAMHEHFNIVMALIGVVGLIFVFYIVRKVMSVRRPRLPIEKGALDEDEDATTP